MCRYAPNKYVNTEDIAKTYSVYTSAFLIFAYTDPNEAADNCLRKEGCMHELRQLISW